MKKVLIFVLVLIIAAALVGPKIAGSQLQSGIENIVNTINKNPNYTASIKSIESTWFTTNAEVSVGLNIPEMDTQAAMDFSVDLILTSSHGPMLTNDGFAIGWLHTIVETKNPAMPENVSVSDNKPLYQFTGLTSLLGTTSYQDEIAGVNYTDSETNGTVVFSGLKGEGKISNSGLAYKGAAQSIKMAVENTLDFDIERIVIDVESSESLALMLSQGLYNSQSSFGMDLVTFKDLVQNTEIRVADTKIIGLTDYDKATDMGRFEMQTSIASVDAPDMSLTDLNTVIEINNIQAKFLLAYQEFSEKMMENVNDPTSLENDLQEFMQSHLLEQLQAEPQYNISNISGKINGSEFNGKVMAKLTGVTEIPASLEDPGFWLKHTLVDSNMLMQKAAAEFIAAIVVSSQLSANPQFMALSEQERSQIVSQQSAGMLDGLVQQGMMMIDGEEYKTSFTLENGKALLNGNPIPL